MVLLCLRLLGLLGPGCCDRVRASSSSWARLEDFLCSLPLMGQPCAPFLSHLSALLLLSLPSVFKDTVVGREKDHNTRATGA